jgi:flagellar basal-body rod modification protein FlgD
MSLTNASAPIGVTSLQASSSAALTPVKSKPSQIVDYDQFLQLLVAELRNQDPVNPRDPTQFISQLASFSAVEQQVRANAALDTLLTAQADHLIGKKVTSADGKITGIVVSVTTSSGGQAIATLKDGRTISLGSGLTVSAA